MKSGPGFGRLSGDIEAPDLYGSVDRACRNAWRWRWLFVAVSGTVITLGALLATLLPVRYTAQALVMVGVREANPLISGEAGRGAPPHEKNVDGAIQLLTSDSALREAASVVFGIRQLPNTAESPAGAEHPAQTPNGEIDPADEIAARLGQRLTAERVQGSTLIKITYSDNDPVVAEKVANAVASTPVLDRKQLSRLTLAERAGFDFVTTWVAAPAAIPSKPSNRHTTMIGLLTVVLALGAGCTAVSLADYYTRRTILTPDQIARAGVRNLGTIPELSRGTGDDRLIPAIFKENPAGIFTDSIAGLHASLMPLLPGYRSDPNAMPADRETGLVLLFTSSLPNEGKSTAIAALGASLAGSGKRVLLIDADLRSPKLHRLFGVEAEPGLSSCLNRDNGLHSLIVSEAGIGVSLLLAGAKHPRPLDILTSAALRQALIDWRSEFDFILIDAPPVLSVADSRILAGLADYCVFIARWRRTGWETVRHALQLLAETGCPIAGVTLSRVDFGEFGEYAYPAPTTYGGSNHRVPANGRET